MQRDACIVDTCSRSVCHGWWVRLRNLTEKVMVQVAEAHQKLSGASEHHAESESRARPEGAQEISFRRELLQLRPWQVMAERQDGDACREGQAPRMRSQGQQTHPWVPGTARRIFSREVA